MSRSFEKLPDGRYKLVIEIEPPPPEPPPRCCIICEREKSAWSFFHPSIAVCIFCVSFKRRYWWAGSGFSRAHFNDNRVLAAIATLSAAITDLSKRI